MVKSCISTYSKLKYKQFSLLSLSLAIGLLGCSTIVPAESPTTAQPPTIAPTAAAPSLPAPTVVPATPTADSTTFDGAEFEGIDPTLFYSNLISTDAAAAALVDSMPIYKLKISIEDNFESINGTADVKVPKQFTAGEEVFFRLYPNVAGGRVDLGTIQINGRDVSPTMLGRSSSISLPLSVAEQASDQPLHVHIEYTVMVPDSLEQSYGTLANFNGVLSLAHAHPMLAGRYEDGWEIDAPAQFGDIAFGESSFYQVDITAENDVMLATTGIEIEQYTTIEDRRVSRFVAGPVRDFYIAASRDFIVHIEQVGETEIRSFATQAEEAKSREALAYTADAMQRFNELIGPYPYTELDIVSTPNLALGVEYPSIFVLTNRLYDAESPYSTQYLETTAVHELAHQWFYSTIGNNQLQEPWLDESLTQYATLRYFEDRYGRAGAQRFRNLLNSYWSGVGSAPIPIGQAVDDYSGNEYFSIVYGRGPLFIATLADEINEEQGDGSFDVFLQDYYHSLKWDVSTTDQFYTMAVAHCPSCEIDRLFAEWVDN